MPNPQIFDELKAQLKGEIFTDRVHQRMYATDASIYRELPLGVAYPKNTDDLVQLVKFARKHKIALIPRAAGTSLAGQCVGQGLVVDTSRHMNQILEINTEEKWVRVQPGVIRDDLNQTLKPYGLFFGPNTSTANRCMMGGMVGNNSSGSTSIRYGTTRDKILEVEAVLSDGSTTTFAEVAEDELSEKAAAPSPEGKIYREILALLRDEKNRETILKNYPPANLHRKNTGYALDVMLQQPTFNLARLLCGSEGTLALSASIKLRLDPLPPPEERLVCLHFNSIAESMKATVLAMQFELHACELMDKVILDCTRDHREFSNYRFFLQGDPAAVLVCELRAQTPEEIEELLARFLAHCEEKNLGYARPVVASPQTEDVWNLRKAGLGLMSNVPGDAKPVACIEDTAVALEHLPDYIDEFEKLMADFGQKAVYYAHAGAGELHLRPILNLKSEDGKRQLREISEASARLVKKYNGSLSGEHGDGRVRAEFIPLVLGEEVMPLLKKVKQTFDPENIFNPGKIVDAPPMDENLRYDGATEHTQVSTKLAFDDGPGLIRAVEKCNGSADCRKPSAAGGTMCPSYRATLEEKDSTRGRANVLREVLAHETNPWGHPDLDAVMELCLACKGCTGECPSNVDMAAMKSEYLYQKGKTSGFALRDRIFAHLPYLNRLGSKIPWAANAFLAGPFSGITKKFLGVDSKRSMPKLVGQTFEKWAAKNHTTPQNPVGKVVLFVDEFTNYNEPHIAIKAHGLLTQLGYQVLLPPFEESGRTYISKGFLEQASRCAVKNVSAVAGWVDGETPLIGLEPSALLTFVDEYPRLIKGPQKVEAEQVAKHAMLLEDFLASEAEAGRINGAQFRESEMKIRIHGHCHQKALAGMAPLRKLLNLPSGWEARLLPSGCCGMAGSFGFEHYDLSMKIGQNELFTHLKDHEDAVIVAPGTSCRHQLKDGPRILALHPAELLYDHLNIT